MTFWNPLAWSFPAPSAVCKNITVELDASGVGHADASNIGGDSKDACGIDSLVLNRSSFDCANIGANAVTLTATDVNGNEGTCQTTVTVEDNEGPTAACQDIFVQLDDSGVASITPDQVDNGSSDACGVASLALNVDTFSYSEVGDNIITLTATDTQGNVDTCTATVFVADVPSSSPSLLPSTSPSERPSLSPSESPSDVSS